MARILLVEDDPEMARLMAGILSVDGHDIRVSGDGLEALDLVKTEPVELLLLDVGVPGVDGFEVCRRVRGRETTDWRTTIVMITGRHDTASKLLAFSVGADDCLVKPLDVLELRSRVTRWIGSRSEQTELVLRRRRDAIREIVSTICHEINNPLSAAVMGVELVLATTLDPDSRRNLDTVNQSLQRIEDVISALKTVEDRTVQYQGDVKMIEIKPQG